MDWLTNSAKELQNLEGVVIVKMPDCVEWGSWTRASWSPSEVAAYFGDIVRANRAAMKVVAGSTEGLSLTIEAPNHRILTQELRPDTAVVYVFDDVAPLGLVRLQAKRLCKVISEHLPSEALEQRSRAERIMEFLLRYAPDAHAIPMRVSLQTGIPIDALRDPASLDDAQTDLLEAASQDILGVATLGI